MSNSPEDISAKVDSGLSREDVFRLCLSMISSFQKERISSGRIDSGLSIDRFFVGAHFEQTDVPLNEEILGIDSLLLLELVMEVSTFFDMKRTGLDDYLFVQRSLKEWVDLVCINLKKLGKDFAPTFFTSGTSGPKKPIKKENSYISEEINTIRKLLSEMKISPKRITTFVPLHHIYGYLWGLSLSRVFQADLTDLSRSSPFSVESIAMDQDLFISTPFLWKKHIQMGVNFPSGTVGISSGEPADETTWECVKQSSIGKLIEIYGSTETGGVGFRDSYSAPFTLFEHLQKKGSDILFRRNEEKLDVQDNLRWTSGHSFLVTGRKDRVIQIAGKNICLGYVEDLCCELPDVVLASATAGSEGLNISILTTGKGSRFIESEIRKRLSSHAQAAKISRIDISNDTPEVIEGKAQ